MINTKEQDVVMEYEKLVYAIAKKYEQYYEKEDLYQVGMMGLMNAYRHFDESYGVKFSTYAYTYVVGEMNKFMREDRSIKVSKDTLKLQKSILKAREVLSQKLMRTPTDLELSLFLDIPEEKIMEAKTATEFVFSLDYCISEEGKEMNLYDAVKKEETSYNAHILDLKNQLEKLPEAERELIIARYYQDRTQQETSQLLGVNQVSVSRSEAKILQKLKNNLVA